MFLNDDLTSEPVVIDSNDNEGLPYYNNITSNVILVPQFISEPRTYEVKFYGTDLTTPFYTGTYQFGTAYSDLQPNEIPYKEYNGSLLTAAWDFKGYSLVQGASNLVPEAYTLTNNQNFYAVFEFVNDIREVIHPEWFIYKDYTYNKQNLEILYNVPESERIIPIEGYSISINPNYILQGKITIPSTYNNKPIIAISDYFAGKHSDDSTEEIETKITHVFCQKNSKLYEIGIRAFCNNITLKYFDFSQNTVRYINNSAFFKTKGLDIDQFELSNTTFYIGSRAFLGSFFNKGYASIINIPGSIIYCGDMAFNAPDIGTGNTLKVGSEENPSRLNIALPAPINDSSIRKFTFNEGTYSAIYFISSLYNSFYDELSNDAITVAQEQIQK